MEMYLVGGAVRDMLMGVKPHDHDFTVVLPPCGDDCVPALCQYDPFLHMRQLLVARGVEIFVETPQFLTIRGRFARDDKEFPGIAADFVLARKDSATSDGRRPDSVFPGTLLDDLSRRDFTVNAMAMTIQDRGIIDPFGGAVDLNNRTLRFVGDPMTRICEDALRVMRALRFVVTKGFMIDIASEEAIRDPEVPGLLAKISEERRKDELSRMFRFDTEKSLDVLASIPRGLRSAIFAGRVRLDATLKS